MGPRSSRYLIFGLAVALAIVAVSFVLVRQLTVTSAAAEPAMRMTVTDPAGACPGDGETCTVNPGQRFTLAVYIDKVPPDPDGAGPLGPGWVDAESYVDYDDTLDNTGALTYKVPGTGTGNDIGGQINAAVDCGGFQSGGQILPGESVNVSCITSGLPPVASTFAGLFVSMDFNCSAADSVTVVELVSEDEYGVMSTGMVASDGTLQYPVSDTLTIVCGAGVQPTATPLPPTATPTGPTATPTLTSTPGPPTATPTITPTFTATGTPTATPETLPGDVDGNGIVNSSDALWVLWVEAGLADEGDLVNPEAADVNGDDVINSIDALFILWIELGLY